MKLNNFSHLSTLPVSAASGLVKLDETFYIVSDDETSLYAWKSGRAESFQLLTEELPAEAKARKKVKPDFESLVLWDEEIVAIPSLSRPNRIKATFFHLTTHRTRTKDLSALRNELVKDLPELNIEGAAIHGPDLILLQRGNGAKAQNALIVLDKNSLAVKEIKAVTLGTINDTVLGFTDAFLENDTLYFIAVAETAKSTYDDGKFVGAILGKMDLSGNVLSTLELPLEHKPEGLWLEADKIFIVTDADDRTISSGIYSAPRPTGF